LICSFSFSVFLYPLLSPEWRSAQADRGKFFLDPRLWSPECLYFHPIPVTLRGSSLPQIQHFIPEAFHTCVKKCFFNLFLCVKELR
jgi:hypothetical protein